jgi:MSHA pilin protein MshC
MTTSETTRRRGQNGLRHAGFTMIELVVVMVVMGILSAVAAQRFFSTGVYEAREYADQVRSVIRYGQKLAIAQNRPIYVSATANRFAVCSDPGCGAGTLVRPPSGSNSGGSVTRAQCTQGGSYVSNWMCEGMPASIALASSRSTEAGSAGSYFYFDAMGRPFNAASGTPAASSAFAQPLTLTFSGNGNSYVVTVEAETGYVH